MRINKTKLDENSLILIGDMFTRVLDYIGNRLNTFDQNI